MTESHSDVNSAQQRHWLYGFNAALLVVVGLMIVIFLMVSAETTRGKVSWDMTSNGTNSLSGSTKKLLGEINERKQPFHVVSLFTDPSNEERANGDKSHQEEKRNQVKDLLNLYHGNSSYLQVDDWGDKARDEIEKEIRDKYQEELKPYETTVKGFDKVAEDISKFAEDESQRIVTAMQKANASPEERAAAGSLQSSFQEMPSKIQDLQDDIHQQMNTTLPEWQTITKNIKDLVDALQANIGMLGDLDKVKQLKMPPALLSYFTEANPRYKALDKTLGDFLADLNKLKPLKVQDVLSGLGRNTIVVLGPDQAKVIPFRDIYVDAPRSGDANPETSAKMFKGEELMSSALLAMARPEKVKVVYITSSAQGMTTGLYSELTAQLEQANFEVTEWSPPGAPNAENPPGPPAQGKGVVWFVFPPEAPQQMFAMPPDPKPVAEAVKKHIDAGGQVLFVATAAGGGMMPGPDKYPYADLLVPYGIEVKPKYSAVQLTSQRDEDTGQTVEAFMPYIILHEFEKHPITTPLEGLPAAFFPTSGASGRTPEVTIVDIARPAPAGAAPEVIVKTPNSPDYWGESDVSARPKFDPQSDMAAPLPLAAVSILHKGQTNEQRIAVIGCRFIGADPVLKAAQPVIVGGQLYNYRLFPGNQELVKNTILWLAGYENMIAVSASANAQSRLIVSPGTLAWLRLIAVPLAPLAALVLGAAIWVSRRR